MSDAQKPGSLGLDFLNGQQRFRRPSQPPANPISRPVDGIRQAIPNMPTYPHAQPQHVASQASVPLPRPRPQPQQPPQHVQPHAVNARAFIAQRPTNQSQNSTAYAPIQQTQSDSLPKRSRFLSKKLWIPALIVSAVSVAIGAFLVLRPHATGTNSNNVTKKVAFTKQPPASNTIAPDVSDAPVSNDDIKNYVIAADMPRMMAIDKLSITARITQIGVTYAGSIQTPDNINDVGWYSGSSKPTNKGVMLMVGHLSGTKLPGIFAQLNTITVGSVIKIQRGDKQTFSYKVVKKESVKAENITMEQLTKPVTANKAGLNLLTSTDGQKTSNGDPVENLVVYAEQI